MTVPSDRRFRFLLWTIVAFVIIVGIVNLRPQAVLMRVQLPPIPGLSGVLTPQPVDGIRAEPVWLDGRRLFHIAQVQSQGSLNEEDAAIEALSQLNLRARNIENNLYQIVNTGFDPDTLEVNYKVLNSLPIIFARDRKKLKEREIMTVTHLDASLSPEVNVENEKEDSTEVQAKARAEELIPIVKSGLIQARKERRTDYLLRQSLIAGGIVLVALASSTGAGLWRKRLATQRQQVIESKTETPLPSPSDEENAIAVRQSVKWRQQIDLYDVERRSLQMGQAIVWIAAVAAIAGLFPYTRGLQPSIVSKPLGLLGVGLATYLAVRLSGITVDRFFSAIEPSEFLDARSSRRLLLRFSTLVPVSKSILAFAVMVVGTIVGLVVLGIDTSPLLAGAGIVGLALSFASQNLLRDAINGFLILMEDQYAVGDVVEIGDVAGLVEYMSLRITQLRNGEGRLITIPHGTIAVVQNLSKDWSRVDLTVKVAYDTDPDAAIETIHRVCAELFADPEWNDKMLEPAEVLGIDELSHEGILIRTWIKTAPLKQWVVARECRRRLKLSLDRAGISIGLPQESVLFQGRRKEEG